MHSREALTFLREIEACVEYCAVRALCILSAGGAMLHASAAAEGFAQAGGGGEVSDGGIRRLCIMI